MGSNTWRGVACCRGCAGGGAAAVRGGCAEGGHAAGGLCAPHLLGVYAAFGNSGLLVHSPCLVSAWRPPGGLKANGAPKVFLDCI